MAVTSPNSEISTIGARSWQKYWATWVEARRKMLTPAPDKAKNKLLIRNMIDELDKDRFDSKHGKDSSFGPAGGEYPIVARKMEDRPKRAAGAKQASNG
jgi:hypothetical protein